MSRSPPDGAGGPGDFWSRRRAAVAAEDQAEIAAEEAARTAEDHAALEQRTDAEILQELGLKDPDEMAAGDDFSAFMKGTVPDRLRRRALRRLWRSNPMLANLDSLVDYGEDYTDKATVVANMQTAYRVGKGMLAHIEKQLAASEAPVTPDDGAKTEIAQAPASGEGSDVGAARAAGPPDPPPPPSDPGSDPKSDPGSDPGRAQAQALPETAEADALPQEDPLPSPRRMRFVYDGIPKDMT